MISWNKFLSFTRKSELSQSPKCPFSAGPSSVPESSHHWAPLSASLLGWVVIIFWHLSIYIYKIAQYCADAADQVLEVGELSAESYQS